MQMIPVLDLLGGVVVRGVGGRRSEYQPIQSSLTTNSAPPAVLDALLDRFQVQTAYVADLDGVMHGEPNLAVVAELARRPVDLMVDAGVRSLAQTEALLKAGASRIVVGSESLGDPTVLGDMVDCFTAARIVFSMDLHAGVPITAARPWKSLDASGIVANAADVGVAQFVLLDLADVGEGRGVRTLPLMARLRGRFPKSWFAVGGGVRSMDDVVAARQAGADAVLVASALHDGRIEGDRKPLERTSEHGTRRC